MDESQHQPLGEQLPRLDYTYVPGRSDHPISNDNGHRFCGWHPVSASLDPDHWRDCDAYVAGRIWFDQGYYWESHEVWERCWIEAGRTGWLADFLKALIKLAAALVKAREGNAAGVQRHARRSVELLDSVVTAAPAVHRESLAGLDLTKLRRLANEMADDAPQLAAEHAADSPVRPTPIRTLQMEG